MDQDTLTTLFENNFMKNKYVNFYYGSISPLLQLIITVPYYFVKEDRAD